jgi:hypothetical protein
MLTRQNQALLEMTAVAEKGSLIDFKDILAVVDQSVVQDLLRAVTPMEGDVGKGFHVRIDSAETAFGDGVALVRLSGTASLNDAKASAQVTVLGAIDTVKVDPASGVLRCNVSILGVETPDSSALGWGDPVGRLTEALVHGGLSTLLGDFEIPVRVEDRLEIPAVDSKRLQIVAEQLPLAVSAQQVRVFGGKLWIYIDVALKPRTPSPR